MWSVDLQRVLPGSRTSNRSNSPQPEVQHEQFSLVPYWDVSGIWALFSQMAGMSPLKPRWPVDGIENSRRKTLWSPPKPSVISDQYMGSLLSMGVGADGRQHRQAECIHSLHRCNSCSTRWWPQCCLLSWRWRAPVRMLLQTCRQKKHS